MDHGSFDDILGHEGFHEIGSLRFQVRLSLWWQPEHRQQLIVLPIGSKALLKGTKSYFLKSITDEGETYARDIPQLHKYLEAHFTEVRIAFSHFRDLSKSIARSHLEKKTRIETPTVDIPTAGDLGRIQSELGRVRGAKHAFAAFSDLNDEGPDLLDGYLHRAGSDHGRKIQELESLERDTRGRIQAFEHLQRQYERNGSAASYSYSVSSNVQLATSSQEFRDAVHSIVKELIDLHRYQIGQKLGGGRLNIHIEEAALPEIAWFEEWMGGALSPRDLERLTPEFATIQSAMSERLMVSPKEDIQANGSVKEPRKLLGARIASTMLRRLDRANAIYEPPQHVTKSARPLRLGRILCNDTISGDDFLLPLQEANHIYISGTTGSGKSYTGRDIVEEATQYDDLNILILDPRNQWAGILCPEDREKILSMYEDFGMDPQAARGFQFTYHCPGLKIGQSLPAKLAHCAQGRRVVSFKGLDDKQRCKLFSEILEAAFEATTDRESESLRLLIVIEEAHRFTRKRVDETGKAEASRAEIVLDRVVREGRKFGCCVVILSQTIRDFAYDAASIRQNTNTKIFMRNSDREIEYAADFIGDGKQIIQLPTATAIVHNPAWGAVKLRIRPPFSKVWEFGPEETARLIANPTATSNVVSTEARALLRRLQEVFRDRGNGLKICELSELTGITSQRRLQTLLQELEEAMLVRSTRLPERGQPRVIEPIVSTPAEDSPEVSRMETEVME